MPLIPDGYYLKARCIQNSDISSAPPHIREIWDWLLKEANHKDKDGIKRGQLIRTYDNIRDGLKWKVGYRNERYTKGQCEYALKFLRDKNMIETTKTTRGLIINICKYGFYQNPKNYKGEIGVENPFHEAVCE